VTVTNTNDDDDDSDDDDDDNECDCSLTSKVHYNNLLQLQRNRSVCLHKLLTELRLQYVVIAKKYTAKKFLQPTKALSLITATGNKQYD